MRQMRMLAAAVAIVVAATSAAAQPRSTIKGDEAAAREIDAAFQRLAGLRSYRMKIIPPPGQQGADKMSMVMEFVNPDRTRMVIDMEDTATIEMIRVGQELRRRITLKGQMAQAGAQSPSLVNQILGGGIFGGLGTILGAIFDPIGFVTNLVVSAISDAIINRLLAPVGGNFRPGVWVCLQAPSADASSSSSSGGEVTIARLDDATIDGARTRGYDMTVAQQSGGRTATSKMRLFVLADRQLPRRMETFDAAGRLQGGMDYYDYDAPFTIDLPACPP